MLFQYGLDFHHAQPGYVMMAKWLPTCEPSMIPEYANQYLGKINIVSRLNPVSMKLPNMCSSVVVRYL